MARTAPALVLVRNTALSVQTGRACAAVVAADDALRASLALLLQMNGFTAVAFAEPQELLDNSRADEEFIILERTNAARSALAELHRRGWKGLAVVLSEDDSAFDWVLEGPHRVLVKPFSSDDLLAILHNHSA